MSAKLINLFEKDGKQTGYGVIFWMVAAFTGFSLAYVRPEENWGFSTASLVLVYLFGLAQLARAPKWRLAFYPGLGVGFMIAASQLTFFWELFAFGAVALWLVFAFWIGLFALTARSAISRFGPTGWLALPFLWIGLEYFRSELYPLKFSWLSPGYAFAWTPGSGLRLLGVYGMGFVLMSLAAGAAWFWGKSKPRGAVVLAIAVLAMAAIAGGPFSKLSSGPAMPMSHDMRATIRIAGAQMEFPAESEVLLRLTGLMRSHPETELIVLSEYTFDGPVPKKVLDWCKSNKVHLVAGGKEELPGNKFYNTAFVISPAGEIVFKQVKTVPIQFMKDGLPAPSQRVWNSPWGKLGICICYDLSYRRATDELIRQGAQALLVPTMDVVDWGKRQHELHARIAPVRAAEYGVPVFRLASSGISQAVDSAGHETATAPFDSPGRILAAKIGLVGGGALPCDRFLVPIGVGLTMLLAGLSLMNGLRRFMQRFNPVYKGQTEFQIPREAECSKAER